MTYFEFGVDSISGIADSDYLDRLAELVYDVDGFIDPTLALNDDGSITASFIVRAPDALTAARFAADRLSEAMVLAKPLREPTAEEIEHGAIEVGAGRFEVREAVYA